MTQYLVCGTLLDKAVCAQAGEVAAAEVEVGTDTRASAEYRRSLIRTYVPAMILRAKERAGGAQAWLQPPWPTPLRMPYLRLG